MLAFDDRRVGDAWFFRAGETWHAYVLTCPLDVQPHVWWDITHATSRDLKAWHVHGEITHSQHEPAELAGCVATGSVIEHGLGGRRYLMAHTLRHAGPDPAVVLRTSDDLHDWHLVGDGPALSLSDDAAGMYEQVGSGSRAVPHFRDPFLFEWNGELHFIVCATRPGRARGGTVAAARWTGERWQLLPPPEMPDVCEELECPQVHRIDDGDWRLVFSSFGHFFNPAAANRSGVYCFRGPTPLGPWHDLRPLQVDKMHAGQLLRDGERWLLVGTNFSGFGSLTDPIDVTDRLV